MKPSPFWSNAFPATAAYVVGGRDRSGATLSPPRLLFWSNSFPTTAGNGNAEQNSESSLLDGIQIVSGLAELGLGGDNGGGILCILKNQSGDSDAGM